MTQPLVMALDKALLIWIGIWILSNRRYKWTTFIFYAVLTALFTYYSYFLIGEWIRPILFIFSFIVANYRKKGWIPEARINFFHLSIVFMSMILGRTWADLIALWISLHNSWYGTSIAEVYEPSISLAFRIIICIVLFFVARMALKKSGVTDFIEQIDAEYSIILSIGMGMILFCYYGVIFIPVIVGIDCSGMVQMQPIYMTFLTFIASGLILFFNIIIKKEKILLKRNVTLSNINAQLCNKKKEIIQKESLLKSLDKKIMNTGNVQKQLRHFKHGQKELLTTLGGAIEAGDKKVIYELLAQYGIKVKAVSKRGLEFPDVSQLKGAELMPLRFFLLSKADDAIEQKINFTTEMSTEILDIGMPVLDFIDILGIWLNNAIEEAIHAEEKWVHTSFILEKDPEGLTILEVRVTNSCRENTLNPMLTNQKGMSTKGTGRGNGLSIVEELMMKHEHIYVHTKVSDSSFMQLLEIVLGDSENED